MTCLTTNERNVSLPGAYCHGNKLVNSTVSPTDGNKEGGNLAIISPIFFSPSLSPGSLRNSLPGTWVDSSPFQQQQPSSSVDNIEKEKYHHHHHHYHYQHCHSMKASATSLPSSSLSSSSVTTKTSSSSSSAAATNLDSSVRDHVNMTNLRQTIAALKKQAKQLEETDLLVKKGIEVVAKKRLLAHHQRRQQSEWDWCDHPTLLHNNNNSGVPILDDLSDDDEDDDDGDGDETEYLEDRQHQRQKCDSDWEWID